MCDCRKCFHFKVCKKAEKVENYKLQGECSEFEQRGVFEIPTFCGLPMEEAVRILKAYNDKRIIELPCKVGDYIYLIDMGVVIEAKVETITFYKNMFSFKGIWWSESFKRWNDFISPSSCWGKTAFPTRAEAEQALSKLQASYEQVKEGIDNA